MGTLTVTEFTTLDGVAQAPGRPDEDRDGGFAHGGWQMPYADGVSGRDIFANAARMDALLLGRRTYEIFADYWPDAPEDIPFTGLFDRVPKYVASRTLTDPLAWEGAQVLHGDLGSAVADLTARHDEVHVLGSLDLVQSLLEIGVIDRLHLWVYPLLLGDGKRVFGGGTLPASLHLVDATSYDTGTVQLTYETGRGATPRASTADQRVATGRGA